MNQEKLESQILSILFASSKPVSIRELAETFEMEEKAVEEALIKLATKQEDSGINVLYLNGRAELSSNPDNSPQVKKFLSLELREKLTDAAMETLAIIVYRAPISKAEIENIRGVNSQYTLRHLLIRGLIEKAGSTEDKRLTLYKPTIELLQHLGIKNINELPDFEELTKNISLPNSELTQPGISPDNKGPEQPEENSQE
ncbi:MAG: SMC-Scp complex subunit ScpB [Acidobacteriaceae bacterium]